MHGFAFPPLMRELFSFARHGGVDDGCLRSCRRLGGFNSLNAVFVISFVLVCQQ